MIEDGGVEFWYDAETGHVHWLHICRTSWGPDKRVDVQLPNSERAWQIVNEEPLTVTPSIRCMSCGIHGFIIEGEWVGI